MSSLPPPFRRLRVYTYDPSLATKLDTAVINQTVLRVPWERDPITRRDLLQPGPVGDYLEVIDFDPASECFYEPVNLNDHHLIAQDGLAPSEGNPQFHQQMVYAVAMTTIANFERALGRRVIWAPRLIREESTHEVEKTEVVLKLRVYPHALREANAYYSPEKKALLFGYFPTSLAGADEGLPGGLVFTCLSHDVVAHETTHAILDGLHRYFAEPSNPDVLAFHEGFADIVALFQHFTQTEALRNQIARTRGDLRDKNTLGELAHQFGQAIGNHGALRDYIGVFDKERKKWERREPAVDDYSLATESHDRGAVLVAALFDAFLSVYEERIADLLRIATGGTGVLAEGNIHPDLVDRLAGEASETASHMLLMAVRALDYCPPVDITFGEYLRALVTADTEIAADDPCNYRVAVIEAFRRRGIYPRDVRVLGQDVLRWQEPTERTPDFSELIHMFKDPAYLPASATNLPDAPNLPTLEWQMTVRREDICKRIDRYRMLTWLWMYDMLAKPGEVRESPASFAKDLGLALDAAAPGSVFRSRKIYRNRKERLPTLEIHSVRVARRQEQYGQTKTDLVIEMTQRRRGYLDPKKQDEVDDPKVLKRNPDFLNPEADHWKGKYKHDFTYRGGCTLLIDGETGIVRYCITKDICSESRLARQRVFAADNLTPSLRATYDPEGAGSASLEPFAMLHRSF